MPKDFRTRFPYWKSHIITVVPDREKPEFSEVTVICRECQQVSKIMVFSKGLEDWANGEYIQKAMPQLDADSRELLISGACGTCFDKMFPPEEEAPGFRT